MDAPRNTIDGRTWMILVESDSSTIDGSHPWLFAYLVKGRGLRAYDLGSRV